MMKIRIIILATLTAVIYVLLNQTSSSFSPNTQTTRNFILLNEKEINLLKMVEDKEKELIYLEISLTVNSDSELELLSQPTILEQAKLALNSYENIVVNDACLNLSQCLSVFISYENESEFLRVRQDILNQIKATYNKYGSNYMLQITKVIVGKDNTFSSSGIFHFIGNLNIVTNERIIEPLPDLPIGIRDDLQGKYENVSLKIVDRDEHNYYLFIANVEQKVNFAKVLEEELANHYFLWGEVELVEQTQANSQTKISETILLFFSLALSFLLSFGLVYLYERFKDYSK